MDVLQEIDEKMRLVNKVRPFEGKCLEEINLFFRIKTTYSSNAVEGNPHTLKETKDVLETGIRRKHSQSEFAEIEGHGRAYDFMFGLINKRGFTENDILTCHQLFTLDNKKFTNPGKYRRVDVVIKESKRTLPKFEEIPKRMLEYISWINKERGGYHPVLFAAEAHRRLADIHPFTDGNNRIARLVMNTCLFQCRYFPVSISVFNRSHYFSLVEKDDADAFGHYIAELELGTVKDLIRFFHIR